MKIIHIAGGGDRGGAKTHIVALCKRLSEMCTLKLVSLRTGEFSEEAEQSGIDVKTIFSRFVPRDYARLISYIKKEKPDLVHCHGAKANVAGILIKLFTGTTVVSTVHSDYRLDYMHSFLKQISLGWLNSLALRLFDFRVTVSDQFKNMMIERGFDPLKLLTLYNGLDFSIRAQPFDRGEYLRSLGLDFTEGDVVLGIPARLTPVKDIPTLLTAFALARRSEPRLKLLIGGDGEDAAKLRALAKKLGLGANVCFCGWINDVPKFFAACDIDVLCSISESFPYSVLEGIRENCAVITSDVGGMRKLIDHGENGFIFTPGDSDTFAEYMITLCRDSELRRTFAEKLHQKASKKYSLDSMAQTQSEIYSQILQIKQRNGRDGVLICGAYGRGNSGDEAILRAIINSMRNIDPLMPITVMTRQPKQTELSHHVRAVYTFSSFKFLKHMLRSRLFINGGGSLIQDNTSSRSLYFYLFTIWAAKRCGCKVIMYGCGIGPVHKQINRRLSTVVLDKNVDIITLRDSISKQELLSLGVTTPEIKPSADPAFSLLPSLPSESDDFFRQSGLDPTGNYICFSVRSWKDFKDFEIFSQAADYAYKRYNLHTVLLPIEHPRDVLPSSFVMQAMETPCTLLTTPDDIELTLSVLKKMRLVCAMRLHALVFSTLVDIPVIASSYDVKVSSFMADLGMEACTDLYEMTAEWLIARIDEAMAEGAASNPEHSQTLRALESTNSACARRLLGMPDKKSS